MDDEKTIFEEFNLDPNKLCDKLAKLKEECISKSEDDSAFIRKLVKKFKPTELAVLVRLQHKCLTTLQNAGVDGILTAYT